jgi:predicted permease
MTAQVAMSVVLLIVGAVLVRSLLSARAIDRGFDSTGVLTVSLDLETRGYTAAQGGAFYEQLLDRLEATPLVGAANAIDIVPLTLSNRTASLLKDGQPPPPPDRPDALPPVYVAAVSRGHFRTMSIPLIGGRDFTPDDRSGRPEVAIVNETLAHRYWPGENPVGKRLRNWNGGEDFGPWIEIVGLARDSKYVTIGEDPKAFMYRPLSQDYAPATALLLKSAGDPAAAIAAVRSAIRELDPELPVFNASTLDAVTALSLLPIQAAALLAGALGIVALVLVAIGIYGVVSYVVRQRSREIGIRMALGAQPTTVVSQLANQGLRMTAIGLVAGLGASLLLTRFLAGLLYGVAATDALSFAGISALLIVTVYLAAYFPARRATAIDPVQTLRYE